ncbi:MAG: hypothetical protein WDA09_08365 [Bacteriovoracaceae bacterium]
MFLKSLIIPLLFISFSLKAQPLHVEYGYNIFSIEVKENEIQYQKKTYKDSVTKKKCSEKLFKKFADRFHSLTKNFPSNSKDSADFMVKYRLGSKAGQLSPTSSFAKKLLSLPQDFESFRLATEFRCEGE